MTDNKFLIRATMLLTALTVSLTFVNFAWAALEAKEEAYEVQLEQILRWPLREGDSLVVRPCRGCEAQTLRVTGETEYATGPYGNRQSSDLSEILSMKSKIRSDTAHLILVLYDPDNQQVTSLILVADF